MEDIFQKALNAGESSIKGLYVCSVACAYRAVFAVVQESEQAVQVVEEAYISAFQSAKSYEEFFAHLNQRVNKACKILIDKNASLAPIEATDSVFTDVTQLDIPQQLKDFGDTLAAVVVKAQNEASQKKPVEKKRRKNKKQKPKTELQEFEELVKKHEFSGFDSYVPEKEEVPEAPKTIAEKLQNEETVITDEQRTLQTIEREKSKRTSIAAFIFASVILAAAIATYFITAQVSDKPAFFFQTDTEGQSTTAVLTTRRQYREGEEREAFEDYYNEVLLKQYKPVSYERIVAYNETSLIGTEQLCGIVCTKQADFDGDGTDEFAVIYSKVQRSGRVMEYTVNLDLYKFEQQGVVPIARNRNLMRYCTYNRSVDYNICNFTITVELLESKSGARLLTQARSKDMKLYSFYYMENGELHEGERLAYVMPEEHVKLYFQRSSDELDVPLYAGIYKTAQDDVRNLSEEALGALSDYGFRFKTYETEYQNEKGMLAYVNTILKRFGCRLDGGFNADCGEQAIEKLCILKAVNEQGDKLSMREVVQITDETAH